MLDSVQFPLACPVSLAPAIVVLSSPAAFSDDHFVAVVELGNEVWTAAAASCGFRVTAR